MLPLVATRWHQSRPWSPSPATRPGEGVGNDLVARQILQHDRLFTHVGGWSGAAVSRGIHLTLCFVEEEPTLGGAAFR